MSKYFNECLIRGLKLFNLGIRFKPLRCLKFVMPPNPHGKEGGGGGWKKKKHKHFLMNMCFFFFFFFFRTRSRWGEERRANSGVTPREVLRHDAAGSDSSLLSRRSGTPTWQISACWVRVLGVEGDGTKGVSFERVCGGEAAGGIGWKRKNASENSFEIKKNIKTQDGREFKKYTQN